MRIHRLAVLTLAVAACAEAGPDPTGTPPFELLGDWYVLVHYRDDRSRDADVAKWKDFVWSIQSGDEGSLRWVTYPFAVFDEEREAVRREAMTSHQRWEPDPELLAQIRKSVRVANRGAQDKTLLPSEGGGYKSPPRRTSGGTSTLEYSRDWTVATEADRIRITIVDTLAGAIAAEGITDTTEYVIEQRVSADELRGTYREPHKTGPFRMLRTRARPP